MFWDNVAWVYDIFANVINRKANRALCAAVAALIRQHGQSSGQPCFTQAS